MKLEVLGCHGDLAPGAFSPGYLLDDRVLIDAGTVCSALSHRRAMKIDHVLVSHAHMDHVKELPFLINQVAGSRPAVQVWAAGEVLDDLSRHLFNSRLWPDFTRLPSVKSPAMKLRSLRPDRWNRVGEYRVRTLGVNHAVPTFGLFIDDGMKVLGYTSDTGPCMEFWDFAGELGERLAAVIAEVTSPDFEQERAVAHGHLTPGLLCDELRRAGLEVPILAVHMKSGSVSAIERQLGKHAVPAHICSPGDLIRI